ncbi:MAG: hypothetical protein J7556_13460 [Acidovorax sp.]|nr:hypothetical protein [Acidovorax sp.]
MPTAPRRFPRPSHALRVVAACAPAATATVRTRAAFPVACASLCGFTALLSQAVREPQDPNLQS